MTAVLRRVGVLPWILLAALVLRAILFSGVQGGDDSYYYTLALRTMKGEPIVTHNLLQTRLGYILPVAGLFSLFGPSTGSLIGPSVLASLSLVAMAYWLGRDLASEAVGRIAAAFVALLPIDVFFATTSTTDVPMAAWIGAGVCLARSAVRGPTDRWSYGRAALAALCWGEAWMTRESAPLFILPILPFLVKRPLRRELFAMAGILLVIGAAYLTAYGYVREDPLYPMTVARHDLSEQEMPPEGLLRRILTIPSLCFNPLDGFFPYTGGLMALSGAGCAYGFLRNRSRWAGLAIWWLGCGLILALLPLSVLPFRPAIFIVPRMYAMLTLPGAVLAAVFLKEGVAARAPRVAMGAAGAAALLAIACAVRVHADGVHVRSGPVWAYQQLRERPGAEILTDPRTAVLIQVMTADAPPFKMRVCTHEDPAPSPGTFLLSSSRQTTISRKWSDFNPPAWWNTAPPPREAVAEQRVPAPWSLRGNRGAEEHTVLWRILPTP